MDPEWKLKLDLLSSVRFCGLDYVKVVRFVLVLWLCKPCLC